MKAFIFDLNGTMIDDMSYHTSAWEDILNNDLGGNFSYEQVKQNMYGKNSEVLVRMFGENYFSDEQMTALSFEKERRYQSAFLPKLQLLPGLSEFLETAYLQNIPMAIASAAIPFNINFVLDNLNIRKYFSAVVSADDVEISKPHPETFLKAAELLGMPPAECVVFEDAPKGAEAAANAHMQCIVLTTTHQTEEFSYLSNILNFSSDYTSDYLKDLLV
ncbi:HAD family hydrolase [Mucilaginibacter aquariorum]|uniref:Beta-phosphoglucomutase n=1 Tax=Mucilaginibacter aquariorum TaxID=2967225 RepID=A0ABT1T784_9SPHI|nr:HAD family phosphatase [Mucilaginibacter aquariorum]MCQ6960096.1 HAD family phosphatase [Mucilaginibacter aquariorum]